MDSRDDPLARFRLNKCLHCGYDLRSAASGSRCPECGLVFIRGLLLTRQTVQGRNLVLGFVYLAVIVLLVKMLYEMGPGDARFYPFAIVAMIMLVLAAWWLIRKPEAHPQFISATSMLCTRAGWAVVEFPVEPSRNFQFTPWTECQCVEVNALGDTHDTPSLSKNWSLRFLARSDACGVPPGPPSNSGSSTLHVASCRATRGGIDLLLDELNSWIREAHTRETGRSGEDHA